MRHRTSRIIALAFSAATVALAGACSSSSSPSSSSPSTGSGHSTSTTAGGPVASADPPGVAGPQPSYTGSPLPGGILPAAVAAAQSPTPPLRALAPGFSLSSFLQHERTAWGIDLTQQAELGTPSPDTSTSLDGWANKDGDRLSVSVTLNEQHQVTMIQCYFGMTHNTVADQFIDDCARTAIPGVDPTAVVAFVDQARTEITDIIKTQRSQLGYSTPAKRFGNDSYIFSSDPANDDLSILGATAPS
jgi:hypothetical protein